MNLAQLRFKHGLSQYDLAEITGVAQPNIAAMERGQRRVTDAMWQRINERIDVWNAEREERADRAVQAAFNKPHLVAMRSQLEGDSI